MSDSYVELPAARHMGSQTGSRVGRSHGAKASSPRISDDADRAYRKKRRIAALLAVAVVVAIPVLLAALIML
ncbi:MAG: hypothetical protein ACQEXN_05580 [Actinomycetota bacterium]